MSKKNLRKAYQKELAMILRAKKNCKNNAIERETWFIEEQSRQARGYNA